MSMASIDDNKDSGALAPKSGGKVAPQKGKATVQKLDTPTMDVSHLAEQLKGAFEQGQGIASLKVQAMTLGHDLTINSAVGALLSRNYDPLATMGEIALPAPDWSVPVVLENPFLEVA